MSQQEKSVDISKNIALTSSQDIDAICAPLRKLGISYFSYVKSFKDGSHIRLANNPHWTQYYYQKKFYNVVLNQVPAKQGSILWKNIDPYPLFVDASDLLNLC